MSRNEQKLASQGQINTMINKYPISTKQCTSEDEQKVRSRNAVPIIISKIIEIKPTDEINSSKLNTDL